MKIKWKGFALTFNTIGINNEIWVSFAGTRGSQGLARDPQSFVGSNTTDNKTAEFTPFQKLNETTSLDVEGSLETTKITVNQKIIW